MSMIGTDELNRAAWEDADVARTFALRAGATPEFRTAESGRVSYAALPLNFSRSDAVSLPGVRLFPVGGLASG